MRVIIKGTSPPRALAGLVLAGLLIAAPAAAQERPNILWLSSEDNGPALGVYGDTYADTPNLDRLGEAGLVYQHAWSNAPVCAPARTALITGMYPTATGGHHMRSRTSLPPGIEMFPQLLRAAGYYATNNAKEDYNHDKPGQVWDESSDEAHWRNRPPGAPFFAVFNLGVTHESRIRERPHQPVHDPAAVSLPAYHPDRPEVRQDWAQYYDRVTEMDAQVGEHLASLEAAGLAGDTVIMYFGDHGVGLPRGKRSVYDSGLRVPLIIYVPPRFQDLAGPRYEPGTVTSQLAAFVNLAPTVLSLAGVEPPLSMHGHALLGPFQGPRQRFLHGFRDRMDERYDFVRGVRSDRYLYVRNYLPHRAHGQFIWYMFQTPTTQVWKQLYDRGELSPIQAAFWEPRSPEELYDLVDDPDETRNLVGSAEHQPILRRLRRVQLQHLTAIRDLGFLPEPELHARVGDGSPFDLGQDLDRYRMPLIHDIADLAARPGPGGVAQLRDALGHDDAAVRYWGAVGLLSRGREAVQAGAADLRRALHDRATSVQIAAAEALGRHGEPVDVDESLDVLLARASLDDNDVYTAMMALNALDYLDLAAASRAETIRALPREQAEMRPQFQAYVPRLIDKILTDLE